MNCLDGHYECIGFLLDYCKNNNISVDIFASKNSSLGYINFYEKFFNNFNLFEKNVIYKDTELWNIEKNIKYDKIIFINDTDFNSYIKTMKQSYYHYGHENIITLTHDFSYRNFYLKNNISYRYYKRLSDDYIYPFYNLISLNEKDKIIKNINISEKKINIAIVSNTNYDYKKLFNNLLSNNKIHIYLFNRIIDNKNDISTLSRERIHIYENADFSIMYNILVKTHYILIPDRSNFNNDYKENKSSGSIELAYNFLCQLIFPDFGYKDEYNLVTPIEYYNNIKLDENIDINKIYNEREFFINKRNNTLNKFIYNLPSISNNPIIRHKIPKKIFQTWETKEVTCVLKTLTYYIKKKNPDYEYYLFDKKDRELFIKENFDETVLKAYNSIIPGGFKADLWRYCVLYKYGGFYCDIDMICINGFDKLIENNEECVFTIDHNLNGKNLKFDIFNAFIGIIPNHPIMKNCIYKIVDNILNEKWKINNEEILEFTGPGLLGKEVNKYFNREEKTLYEFYNDYNYFKKYKVNLINFADDQMCGFNYKSENWRGVEINIRNEFIKTIDNYYIFQNKNGNDYLKQLYNDDIKIYNLKEWTTFSQNNLPYNLDSNYCIFTNDNNIKINLIEHELSNI